MHARSVLAHIKRLEREFALASPAKRARMLGLPR